MLNNRGKGTAPGTHCIFHNSFLHKYLCHGKRKVGSMREERHPSVEHHRRVAQNYVMMEKS
jgi:hypothetical protein